MKFNGWEELKPIPDMLISKNEVLMLIANYQMGTDPHSEIGDAQYSILEMLFRSVQSLRADRKTENCSEKPNNSTISKMETQNSNLTFEKRTMRDCYNCKRYETEGECIECNFEPKDEPQTERIE